MTPVRNPSVAIYARISLDPAGDALGVARQLDECRALAHRLGLAIAGEYVDNDISAYRSTHRPAYELLLTDIRAGQINTVIVFHLSRLWRSRRQRATGIEAFREHGIRLIMVRGPEIDFSTAYGRGMAEILGSYDTMESEIKSERQVSAIRQAVKQGRPPGGRRAFGYTRDGADIVPAEAAAVRRAYDMLLAGASTSSIARWLTDAGHTTTVGRPWRHTSVRAMLTNSRYAGLREYRGELYPGTWPAIVPEDTWRAARAILDDPARRTTTTPARRWLLSGLAICGVCGEHVISTYRDGRRRVYRCRASAHLVRSADPIDEFVTEVIIARLSREDARDLLIDDTRPDVESLRGEALRLRARMDELAALYADDRITASQLETSTARLRARLTHIEAEMRHAGRAPVLADLVEADDVRAAWQSLTLDRRRAVLSVLATVEILKAGAGRRAFDPSTIRITWKTN